MQKDTFAERLRLAREKKGMGLKELREAVGVSQSAMSHYSTGATLPPLDVAVKIAEALGVSLNWLCGKDEFLGVKNSYGYVVRMMLKIDNAIPVWYLTSIDTWQTDKDNFVRLTVEVPDSVYSFFQKKERFEEMARENTEAREMYDAWLAGALRELDSQKLYEEVDDDLPSRGIGDAEKEAGGE